MAKTTLYLLLLVALSGCSPSPNAARVADTVVSKASTSPMSEEQATAYIYNAGYRDIKGLIRDDGGAWHGQATKGGRTTRATVDREGAVTSG